MNEQKPLVILRRLRDKEVSEYPNTKFLVYEDKIVFVDPPQPEKRSVKIIIKYDEIKEVEALHNLDDKGSLKITTYEKKSYKVHHTNGDLVSKARRIIDKKIEPLQFERKINNAALTYAYHSLNLSVRYIVASEKFYEKLGFKKVYERYLRNRTI